jgi:phage terminase small subunit
VALTVRQSRFVEAFLKNPNATEAAVAAGYSRKTAYAQGSRLLKNAEVARAIAEAQGRRAERVEVKADDILRELLRLATTDIGKAFNPETGQLLPLHEMPEEVRRSISGIEVETLWEGRDANRRDIGTVHKVKFWDKVRGLELLGKHLKLFTDKVQVEGNVSIGLVDPYARDPEDEK